jgi:hypothetical protein
MAELMVRIKGLLIISFIFGFFAGPAFGIANPTVMIDTSDGLFQKTYSEGEIQVLPNDTYFLEDQASNGVFEAAWNLTFKSDPYAVSWVSIRNTTGTSQIYTVTFIEPVSPTIGPSSIYGGSVGGSLTTDALGGYVSTVPPESLYLGMIDGIGILSFYPHPSSLSRPNGGTTMIDLQETWGLVDGPVNSGISIQHKFELGPGDALALSGYFQVEPVPEPATLFLLAAGAAVVLRRRSR